VSPRRNRPRRAAPAAPAEGGRGHGLEQTESWRGEEWVVRPVAGSSGKRYRCPGCDQEIPPGVGHVVAWPQHGDVDDRRHWHRACWNARDRRGAKILRARNAPRY
jgi:hypothetical protein